MASTFTTSNRFTLQGDGENESTWGSIVNNVFQLIEESIDGVASIDASGSGDLTLTSNDGSSDQSRHKVLKFTGTPTAARDVLVPNVQKVYLVDANHTAETLTLKIAGGSGVSFDPGQSKIVYADGTDVIELVGGTADGSITTAKLADDAVTYAKIQDVSANLRALGRVSGGSGEVEEIAILDEDDFSSNSATSLATQQSIKAYVNDSTNSLDASAITSGTLNSSRIPGLNASKITGGTLNGNRLPTSYGAVGTYVFAVIDSAGAEITEGNTYSGSQLRPAGIRILAAIANDGSNGVRGTKGGATLSGTWRAMGRNRVSKGGHIRMSLFVRIS